tara:strand:- start:4556 stop:4837 length:282 start_codon:yes stop_codon:yes gene_type:complete
MGKKKKRTNLPVASFHHRLSLVATARGITLNKLFIDAGVQSPDIAHIVKRGYPPTHVLIQRLMAPQGVPSATFTGSLINLAMFLKKEIKNGLE